MTVIQQRPKQPPPPPSDQPLDAFRERMWELRNEERYEDVTLVVGQAKFRATKLFLAVESPWFLQHFKENRNCSEVVLSQFPPPVVYKVLEFIYRGILDDYALPGLRNAAEFFQLHELKERCPEPSQEPAGIHAGNVVQEIVAALKSGDKKHQDAILAFIFEHPAEAQQAAQSAAVATLAAVQPDLAQQIQGILSMKKAA